MIVVDVETTGVDFKKNAIVSLSALDFDHPENVFYEECRIPEWAEINPQALTINGYTEEQIRDPTKQTQEQLIKNFLAWTKSVGELTIAGINVYMDLYFIMESINKYNLERPFAYRIVELHTLVFTHHIKRNIPLPLKNGKNAIDSDFIMNYVGLPVEPKPHIAINGAKWEAEAFARIIQGKSILKEFLEFPVPEYLKQ